MSDLDERITKLYGERCTDHEPSCACCVVWDMRDSIEAQAKEIAELKAALRKLITAVECEADPIHEGNQVQRRAKILIECAEAAEKALPSR